ncbi:Lysophospholipase NTE1 [Elsinoe australis]|uniref:Lysophospholipase NTE1 n=1 Tax=Elsinoe australis TaxID=40998 RepID=A0A2P7ZJK0_9PEZI|nr:Lysophospholipase NTE1 [Elsinoe australis]
MSATDSVIYEHDETKGRGTRTSDDEETFEMQSFLHTHPRPLRRHVIGHPLFVAFAAAVSSLLVFSLGFSMGKSGTSIAQIIPAGLADNLAELTKLASDRTKEAAALIPGTTSSSNTDIFDVLRSLPPVDLQEEYGLNRHESGLYSEPLGEKICILNVDTRKWSPEKHKGMKHMQASEWGYLNHYLYAQLHGYRFKHVQVPEQKGLGNTWVKVKELYRMAMRDECQFVVMLDGDTVFQDIRIPLEALLGHWNVTEDIAIAGGIDLDMRLDDFGKIQFNTGFVIAQNTPIFSQLMQDWIKCPTDVKYKTCSKWATKWQHEQRAFSNWIRYDYPDSVRELPVEEIHLGRFIRHYWGKDKQYLEQGSKDALLNRFLPDIYKGLLNDWNHIHEHPTLPMYDELMKKYAQHSEVSAVEA